jgi:D-sedoheptulose 7-phosphate isomerase
MTINYLLTAELEAHTSILQRTAVECGATIDEIAENIIACFRGGNKLLLCGNGGSAADTQHVAAEFINRFRFDRPALPAIALTTDTSILTAIGNDSSFDLVFSRQVEALAVKGDILVGISTSGSSANVLKALDTARGKGITVVGFTGEKGRKNMGGKCDYCLIIPSADTARIQECHEFVWHVICSEVENQLFGQSQPAQSGEKHE